MKQPDPSPEQKVTPQAKPDKIRSSLHTMHATSSGKTPRMRCTPQDPVSSHRWFPLPGRLFTKDTLDTGDSALQLCSSLHLPL